VPFRNQGIARHLLSYMIANTYEEVRESITIFTDPTDSPVQFYRRMGFTEEVYWQARYVYTPTNGMD
jgi:GNAT superfamily N-acetyltransferase